VVSVRDETHHGSPQSELDSARDEEVRFGGWAIDQARCLRSR